MNIIDAIKSGKKFRRKGWSYFIDVEEFESFYNRSKDILADDWEIEEKIVPITASLLDNKARPILNRWAYNAIYNSTDAIESALKELKKELGL